ncbi:transmembrane protein 176A isoform X1 [Microcaecilia unicolor]|uniref:Transmembrane protein 176A-like isoform X1 n=1 Tax=Microcaecilia unicolor TaxID=1415580 RepID=A0A6P7ZVS7_9AMPH|nr:transmembrane protein 176A-like isoform X1 [Microcaecilia unicolor]XP_030077889.1 transmembrane protein 176A-like isoform X1 [Microcaecilia unicolor]
MSSNVVSVNGADVTTNASDRTVINITINQSSSLMYLMESLKSLGKGIGSLSKGSLSKGIGSLGVKTIPVPGITMSKGEQKTLGAVQIIVGCILFAFGILVCFGPYNPLNWNGVLFWTGVPFIFSGVVSVLTERRPTRCWLLLSPWTNILSFGIAIAGIVCVTRSLGWLQFNDWWYENICESHRSYDGLNEDRWRVNSCKEQLSRIMNFGFGVNIILMVLMILELCITFFSVCYNWKVLCCVKSSQQDDGVQADEDTDPLLAPEAHPPPYEEKIGNVETV